jgi:hypothetical protein
VLHPPQARIASNAAPYAASLEIGSMNGTPSFLSRM